MGGENDIIYEGVRIFLLIVKCLVGDMQISLLPD